MTIKEMKLEDLQEDLLFWSRELRNYRYWLKRQPDKPWDYFVKSTEAMITDLRSEIDGVLNGTA